MKVIIENEYLIALINEYPNPVGKRKFPFEIEKKIYCKSLSVDGSHG